MKAREFGRCIKSFYDSIIELQSSYAVPFIVDGYIVGLVRPDVLKVIRNYPIFKVYNDSVELTPLYGHDYETRSREVEAVINEWRKNKIFVTLNGWRDEVSLLFHL